MTSPSSREGDRIGRVWFLAEACCQSMTAYFGWGTSRPAEGCAPASRLFPMITLVIQSECQELKQELAFGLSGCGGRSVRAQRLIPTQFSRGGHWSRLAGAHPSAGRDVPQPK